MSYVCEWSAVCWSHLCTSLSFFTATCRVDMITQLVHWEAEGYSRGVGACRKSWRMTKRGNWCRTGESQRRKALRPELNFKALLTVGTASVSPAVLAASAVVILLEGGDADRWSRLRQVGARLTGRPRSSGAGWGVRVSGGHVRDYGEGRMWSWEEGGWAGKRGGLMVLKVCWKLNSLGGKAKVERTESRGPVKRVDFLELDIIQKRRCIQRWQSQSYVHRHVCEIVSETLEEPWAWCLWGCPLRYQNLFGQWQPHLFLFSGWREWATCIGKEDQELASQEKRANQAFLTSKVTTVAFKFLNQFGHATWHRDLSFLIKSWTPTAWQESTES